MTEANKILEFTIPLRFYYDNLNDEEFKIVMVGLSEKELEILRLVYGNNYSSLNLVKSTNYETNILYRVLTEKIPERVDLVIANRNKKVKERPKSLNTTRKVPEKKNIYAYFKKHSHEVVVKAILHLEPKDYQLLMLLCDNDLTKPLDLSNYPKFYNDLYYKIERRILNSKNYDIKNIQDEDALSDEIKKLVAMFIESQTYQDLLNLFSPEEALLYAMHYGLIDNKIFSMEEISLVLGLDAIEIRAILNDILTRLQSKPDKKLLKTLEKSKKKA